MTQTQVYTQVYTMEAFVEEVRQMFATTKDPKTEPSSSPGRCKFC